MLLIFFLGAAGNQNTHRIPIAYTILNGGSSLTNVKIHKIKYLFKYVFQMPKITEQYSIKKNNNMRKSLHVKTRTLFQANSQLKALVRLT